MGAAHDRKEGRPGQHICSLGGVAGGFLCFSSLLIFVVIVSGRGVTEAPRPIYHMGRRKPSVATQHEPPAANNPQQGDE